MLVEVDGDAASSESYVTVVLWTLPDAEGRQSEIVARGRYLDRWAKRDGRWAIEHREHVVDTDSRQTLTRGDPSETSRRDERDPSYGYLRGA